MSEKVPAWKRIGLEVKKDVEEDPLATTTHLEHDTITNKIAKKLNKKRKAETQDSKKSTKAPKRVKAPKSERAPPPEKDQLAYLRQYEQDKDNWKFSKQKQNWLLKNIETIPQDFEKALILYVEGIQGGARTRLVDELMIVINKWNKIAEEIEERVNAELYGDKEESDKPKSILKNSKSEEKEEEKEEVLKDYAVRCKKLVQALQGTDVELKGVDDEEEENQENGEASDSSESEPTEESSKEPSVEETTEPEAVPEPEDNLVIDEVEVDGFEFAETPEPEAENKQAKKERKAKKDKKNKEHKKTKKEKKKSSKD